MSAAANLARIAALTDIKPATAIVLGSGLGDFVDTAEDAVTIPYSELDGFPPPGVSGHAGALVLGRIAGCPVAILSGRAHYYESGRADVMRLALATVGALGADTVILTNSAGSLRQNMPPGSVMMIDDHIAFSGRNPLIGEPDEARFVGMTEAYDVGLRGRARAAAEAESIPLPGGVYIWFSGPSFETPAEIRAARALGADAVGMSTVPETILARFLGLKVLGFSAITNYAAGMTGAELSHDETKEVAPEGGAKLASILTRFLGDQAA
jgi:purine-nucleoside phosphorylase